VTLIRLLAVRRGYIRNSRTAARNQLVTGGVPTVIQDPPTTESFEERYMSKFRSAVLVKKHTA
jgi:hypothetical protein